MKVVFLLGAISTMALAIPQALAQATGADSTRNDIVVTGERLQDTVQAGKSDIPLIETPQAISVVSGKDIDARGVTRLSEALRTVAGVSRSTTYGFYDAYTIRGFDAAYGSVYLDGLVNEAGVGLNQELSAIEQIEVLKGPASMLFGQAPLGGLINLVSKRPQADAFLRLTASTGSWNLIEGTVDANAPLNQGKTLLARINLTYRDADSFVRNAGINRIFVAPAITWQPGRDTTLTLLGRYQRDRDNPFSPVPAYGTVLPGAVAIPEDFAINNAGDQRVINNRDRWQVGYIFDHRFSDALSFSQTLRYTHRKEYWNRWMFAAGFLDANGQPSHDADGNEAPTDTIGRYFYGPYRAIDKDFAVDSRLKGSFTLGGITNEWIAGIDYRHNSESYFSAGDYDPTHFPLRIANPDYHAILDTSAVTGAGSSSTAHQTGIYVQDHLKFGDIATLTLGGRYDWANAAGQKDKAFSPRIGATVKLVPGVNAYASWSRSFLPQLNTLWVIGFDGNGNPIGGPVPPERGRNVEAGLKFAPDARLSGSLAVYQLTRQNVATANPIYPDFSVITGEQQSRGVEAELRWQPVAGFSLNAAYTYVDAKITKDNFFTVGAPLSNIPAHNVGIFAQYEVPKGPLAGLGATLAFTYNSKRNGDVYSTRPDGSVLLWLPAYTLVDAGLSYQRDGWGVRLTVANLFDERYWPDTGGIDRVSPGTPRNFRLTLSRDF
ncbi:TonB-dependent receptor [Sphingomonas sp. CL5.1]|uniref:TonB-dependent siderophore receptor n=1 Tax=Sphingomonas sp. CL5.1 TaxID=2653203 RepID=UPI0015841BDE|nr:TonB-dependent receptor [Sphingomonas sp. CL5.1]QKR98377.1 TonB-dependent receptor [Sphingomonas sp. CL5.1]